MGTSIGDMWYYALFVCVMTLLQLSDGQSISQISPREGSTAGGTEITITFQASYCDSQMVIMSNDYQCIQCDVRYGLSTCERLIVVTRPMPAGDYTLLMSGVNVNTDNYCDQASLCTYTTKDINTPRVVSVPIASRFVILDPPPVVTFTIDMVDRTERLQWLAVGERPCEVGRQGTTGSSQLGVVLDQSGNTGTVTCQLTVTKPGIYGISFSVSGALGSSKSLVQFPSADRKIGDVEVIDKVTSITPNSGNLAGGTLITISRPRSVAPPTGNTGPASLPKEVKVFIGDQDISSDCQLTTDPGFPIVCKTPAKGAIQDVYMGADGFVLDIFNNMGGVTLEALKMASRTEPRRQLMTSHWSDLGASYTNFATRMTFCLKPPEWLSGQQTPDTSQCRLIVTSDLNVMIDLDADPESTPQTKETSNTCLAANSPCKFGPFSFTDENSYCMTAYSVGGGPQSYMTLGLECYDDNFSSDNLPRVVDEVQRIRLTQANYNEETYVFDKTALTTSTPGQPSQQTVTVTAGSDYTITYTDDADTLRETTLLPATSDALAIQKALETAMLLSWADRPLPYPIVTVAATTQANNDVELQFTFNSILGDVAPLDVKTSSTTFTVTATQGQISTTELYLTLGTSLSAPVDLTSLTDIKLRTSLLPLMETTCPSLEHLGASSSTLFVTGFEEAQTEVTQTYMGTVRGYNSDTDGPFCGKQYVHKPVYLYKDTSFSFPNTKNVLPQTGLKLCFAYKLTSGTVSLKAQFLWTGALLDPHTAEIELVPSTDLPVNTEWTYMCRSIHALMLTEIDKLLNGVNADDVEVLDLQITAVKTEAAALNTPDFSFDQVYIGWGPDPSATQVPRYFPAKVKTSALVTTGHKLVSDIIVTETATDTYSIVLKSEDCVNNYIFDTLNFAGDPGANFDVSLTRLTSASATASGTVTLDGQTVSLHAPAGDVKRAIEMNAASGPVKVTRTGNCAERDYLVTFMKPDSTRPIITATTNALGMTVTVGRIQNHALTFEVIPFSMCQSEHTLPQVLVYVDGMPCWCENDCSFTYDNTPQPSVTSVNPNTVTASCTAGTSLTFAGTGLTTSLTAVKLLLGASDGTSTKTLSCDVTASAETSLVCDVTLCVSQDMYDVTLQLVHQSDAPVTLNVKVDLADSDVTPTTGRVSGGTLLTITGHPFVMSDTFSVDATDCKVVPEMSNPPASMICRTPGHALGAVKVTVSSGGITPTANTGAAFEYVADTPGSAVITGINPNTAKVDGRSMLTITGTDLGDTRIGRVVKVGAKEAEIVTWEKLPSNDIQVTIRAPTNPTGDHSLRLTDTSSGTDAFINTGVTAEITYSLIVTHVTPSMGALSGGTMLSIFGSGFPDKCHEVRVTMVPKECEPVTCSSNLIQCRVVKRPSKTYTITNSGSHPDLGPGYDWSDKTLTIQPHDEVMFSWSFPPCTDKAIQIVETGAGPDYTPIPASTFNSPGGTLQKGTHKVSPPELGTVHLCSSEIGTMDDPTMRMCVTITIDNANDEKVDLKVFVNKIEATYTFQALTTPEPPALCSCPDLPEPEPSSGEEMIDYPGYVAQTKPQLTSDQTDQMVPQNLFDLGTSTGDCSPTTTASKVSYPASGSSYAAGTDCTFTVSGTVGQTLYIRFERFHLENSPQCQSDYLQLYEGADSSGKLVARLCGQVHPYQLQLAFASGQMFAYFHSDALVEGSGFVLEISDNVALCSVTAPFTTDQGFFISPGLIQAFEEGSAEDFLSDDLSTTGDEIDIRDNFWDAADYPDPNALDPQLPDDIPMPYSDDNGDVTKERISKAERFLSLLVSDGWHSEGSDTPPLSGYLQWSQLDRIKHQLVSGYHEGNRFNFLTPDGATSTPVVPPSGCEWRIKPDTAVTLHVYHLNFDGVDDCANNNLKVFGSSTTPVGDPLCGGDRLVKTTTLGDITLRLDYTGTLTNVDYLIFYTTDSALTSLPFPTVSAPSAICDATTASSGSCGACTADDVNTASSLTMLPTGGKYGASKDCAWTIPASTGKNTWLLFTVLDLQPDPACQGDYIEVHNGADESAPLIGRFCGQSLNGMLNVPTDSGTDIFIRFHSDANTQHDGTGFQVHWSYGAPASAITVNTKSTYISSPDILDYDTDITDATYIAEASFHSLTTYNLYDGLTAVTQADPTYPWVPPVGLSHQYPRENTVSWTIEGQASHTVNCRVILLEMFAEGVCATNELKLFSSTDGSTTTEVQSYCNSMAYGDWVTLGTQYATVTTTTTSNDYIMRFLVYCEQMSTTSAGCVSASAPSPVSTAVNTLSIGPGTSTQWQGCEWTLTAPSGHVVLIVFEVAARENKQDCTTDDVKVYAGTDTTATPLVIYSYTSNPGPTQSTGTVATVTFTSGGTYVTAMLLRYLAVPVAGTDTLNAAFGMMTSPGWLLGLYPVPSSSTTYEYTVTSGANGLTLFIADVDVGPPGVSCTNTHFTLTVEDKITPTTLLTSECADNQGDIYTSSNDLTVTLTLGPTPGAGRGFVAVYYSHSATCGRQMSADTTVTFSGSSGSPCVYVMKAGVGQRAQVDITALNMGTLDPPANCREHYLEVYYDKPQYDPEIGTMIGAIGRYCGTTSPPVLTSTGQFLMLVYVSPDAKGTFTADFSEVTPQSDICEIQVLQENIGMMVAPRPAPPGPPGYQANVAGMDCTMTVTAAAPSNIILAYQTDMEDDSSTTKVTLEKDGSPYSGLTLTATMAPAVHVVPSVTSLKFIFVSGANPNNKAGFIIYYMIVGTSEVTEVTDSNGELAEDLSTVGRRAIVICPTTMNPTQVIQVTFSEFRIKGQDYRGLCTDSVRLYNPSNLDNPKEWCGSTLPGPTISSGKCVLIVATIKEAVAGASFTARYIVSNNPVICSSGTPVTAPKGELTSPGYPLAYPPGLTACVFTIDVSGLGANLLIFVTYDLNLGDSLEIREGLMDSGDEVVPGGLTDVGNIGPILTTRQLHIKFTSDAMLQDLGFQLSYHAANQEACGAQDVSKDEGWIQSPYFPGLYPHNTVCAWKLASMTNPTDKFIELWFYSLQTEGGDGCPYDRIQLFDLSQGQDQNNFYASWEGSEHLPFDGILCGIADHTTILTPSHEMLVVFSSDNSNTYSGFSAYYQIKPKGTCALTVGTTPSSGTLYSPNYPLPYPADADCTTTLTAPAGSTILITLQLFVEEGVDNSCNFDKLTISDPSDPSNDKTFYTNGFDKWGPSAGTTVTVRFQSDSSVQDAGYILTYAHIPTTAPTAMNGYCSESYPIPDAPLQSGLPLPLIEWVGTGAPFVCEYTVEPSSSRALLTIYYSLRPSPDGTCSFNRIMVNPGGKGDLTNMKVLCGKDVLVVELKARDSPWIKVIALSGSAGEKVSIFARKVDGCGGLLTSTTGLITSPTTSSVTPNTMECFWVLQALTIKSFELTFSTFNLGTCAPNSNNWLDVTTGLTDILDQYKPPLEYHFCGNRIPRTVYADTQWLFITFVSDMGENSGFSATFTIKNKLKDSPDVVMKCSGSLPPANCPSPTAATIGQVFQPAVSFSDCSTPTVTAYSPRTGQAGTVLTITGTGFSRSSCFNQVFLGDIADPALCHVTMSSETELRCTLEDDNALTPGVNLHLSVHVHNKGIARIDITDPDNQVFTPKASVISVSPAAGSTFGGTLLTVYGTGVGAEASTVKLDTTDCPVVARRQEVVVCKTAAASAATVQVSVSVPGNTDGDATCPDCRFTYSMDYTPLLKSLQVIGAEFFLPGERLGEDCHALHITITDGSDNIYLCQPMVCTESLVKCDIIGSPAYSAYEVRLWKFPFGYSNILPTLAQTPVITSLTPATGSIEGGTLLRISGSGFPRKTSEVTVTINGNSCPVKSSNGILIICETPAGAGSVNLLVTLTPDPSAAPTVLGPETFTYDIAYTSIVTSVTPSSTQCPNGLTLSLTGTLFETAASDNIVNVGGVRCDVTGTPTTTSVTCDLTHRLVAGTHTLTLQTIPRGIATTAVTLACDLSATLSPSDGGLLGGMLLTMTGHGFSNQPSVTVCDQPCPVVQPPTDEDSTVVCTVPAHTDTSATSGVQCNVKIGIDAVATFTYMPSKTAIITSITPTWGSSVGGYKVTITGQNLGDVNEVSFGCIECDPATIAITGGTSLICDMIPVTETTQADSCIYLDNTEYPAAHNIQATSTFGTAKVDNTLTFSCIDTWSSPTMWTTNKVPKAGDVVVIDPCLNVLLDTATPPLYALVIHGVLIFERKQDVHLRSTTIYIRDSGILQIGTEANPYTFDTTITMEVLPNLTGFIHAATLVVEGGQLNIHGNPPSLTWTKLESTANAGVTTLTLMDNVNWKAGDRIIITPTGKGTSEERVIDTINGKEITLTAPLTYEHLGVAEDICGEVNSPPKLQLRAEVGLLTRNVQIEGSPGNSDKGAVLLVRSPVAGAELPKVRVKGVEFTIAGQPRNRGLGAIHFARDIDMTGSYLSGSSIHKSFDRGIVLCDIQGFRIENNIIHDTSGSAIALQCGMETDNSIIGNLLSDSCRSIRLTQQDGIPAAMHLTNLKNTIRNNAISGSGGHGILHDFSASQTDAVAGTCSKNMPVTDFSGNVVHSCTDAGLYIKDYQQTTDGLCQGSEEEATISGNIMYANRIGVLITNCGKLNLRNFILVANTEYGLLTRDMVSTDSTRMTISDVTVVGQTTHLAPTPNVVCTAEGIVLPLQDGFLIDGLKVANFNAGCYPLAVATSPDCPVNCGGFQYHVTRAQHKFECAVIQMINFRGPFGGVVINENGNLLSSSTGKTAILPNSNVYEQVAACSPFAGYMICDGTVNFARVEFYNGLAMNHTQLQFTTIIGQGRTTATVSQRGNRKLNSAMALLPLGEKICIEFSPEPKPSNFSYNIDMDYLTDDADYIVFCHTVDEQPEKMFTLQNYGGQELVIPPNPLTDSPGSFFYDATAKEFSYLAKRTPGSTITTATTTASFDVSVLKCLFENCIQPLPKAIPATASPPEDLPPAQSTDSVITIAEGVSRNIKEDMEGKCLVVLGTLLLYQTSNDPIELKFECIYVGPNGAFLAGEKTRPLTRSLTIILKSANRNCDCHANAREWQYFAVHGYIRLFGKATQTVTHLDSSAAAGSKTITVVDDMTNVWFPEDKLVLTASSSTDPGESEEVTIESVNGNVITLKTATTKRHTRDTFQSGSSKWYLNTGVGLTTHNIKIMADPNPAFENVARFYISDLGQGSAGYMQLSQVEFRGLGIATTSQAAVSFKELDAQTDWMFEYNSIIDSKAIALEVAGTHLLPVRHNVINSAKASGIKVKQSKGVIVEGNLVVNIALAANEPTDGTSPTQSWDAAIDLRDVLVTAPTVLRNNLVSGCRQIGLAIPGPRCGLSSSGIDMRNNEVAACTVGVHILNNAEQDCTQVKSLTVHKCAHFGLFIKALSEVQVNQVYLADNLVGLGIMVQAPTSTATSASPGKVTIQGSLLSGTSDTYDCDNVYTATAFESKPPVNLTNIHHVGILWPEVVVTLDQTLEGASWTDRTSSDATNGLLEVKDSTFFNFKSRCSGLSPSRDFVVTPSIKSTDVLFPLTMTENVSMSTTNVDAESRVFFPYPDPSLSVPKKCGLGTLCDPLMNAVVKVPDNDPNNFLTLVPNYESLWTTDSTNVQVKLGDALVNQKLTETNLLTLPRGLDAKPGCSNVAATQGKVCPNMDYCMLRIENTDVGALNRLIGPLTVLATVGTRKTIDMETGPAVDPAVDPATCNNQICTPRPPFFYHPVIIDTEIYMLFTKQTPNRMQLTLLNTPDNKCMKAVIDYSGLNRQYVFKLVDNVNRKVSSGAGEPNVRDAVGSNYFNSVTLKEYVIVCGGSPITISQFPVTRMDMTVNDGRTEEEIIAAICKGLTDVMKVPPSFCTAKVANNGNGKRRKRTTDVTVQAAVGPTPQAAEDVATATAYAEALSTGESTLINMAQTNMLDIGVTITAPIAMVPSSPPVGSAAHDELDAMAEAQSMGMSTMSLTDATRFMLFVADALQINGTIEPASEGEVFLSVPVLHTIDNTGSIIPQLGTATDPWRLSVTSSTPGVVIEPQTTVNFYKGVARFDNFRINKEASNIILNFFVSYPANQERLSATYGPFDVASRRVDGVLEIKTNQVVVNSQTYVYIIIINADTQALIPNLGWKGQTWRWTLSLVDSNRYGGTMKYTDKHETIPVGNTGRASLTFDRIGRTQLQASVSTDSIPDTRPYNFIVKTDPIDILSAVAADESRPTVTSTVTFDTEEVLVDNAVGTRRRRRALTSSGSTVDLEAEVINALAWRFPNVYFSKVTFNEKSISLIMRGEPQTLQEYSNELMLLVSRGQLPITIGGTSVTVKSVNVGLVTGTVAATSPPKTNKVLLIAILVPILIILIIIIIIAVIVVILKSSPKAGSTVNVNAESPEPRQGSAISNRSQAHGSREAFVDQDEAMARETSEMFRARTTPEPDQPATEQPITTEEATGSQHPPTDEPTTTNPAPAEPSTAEPASTATEPPKVPASTAAAVTSRPPSGSVVKTDRVKSPAPKAPTEEGRVSVAGSRPASSADRPASSATLRHGVGESAPSPMPDLDM